MVTLILRKNAGGRVKGAKGWRGQAEALKTIALRAVLDEKGEGFVDVLVKMLIVVVVGAVLLTIMRQAIPQLFTDMMTKIRDIFQV